MFALSTYHRKFLPVPLRVLKSEELASLSPCATRLLVDIASPWRPRQNRDARIAFEKVMRPRGWRFTVTLYKAIKELCQLNRVILTRQDSLHKCSLYDFGFLAIGECDGKLDIKPAKEPPNHFRNSRFSPKKQYNQYRGST